MSSCASYQTLKPSTPVKIVRMKDSPKKEVYSLTENVFDPSKFSPPNNFIANLKKRMTFYEDSKLIFSLDNN